MQEHVFWVVSLNTLFILVFGECVAVTRLLNFHLVYIFWQEGHLCVHCLQQPLKYFCLILPAVIDINLFVFAAFCPYHIGQFAILGFRLKNYVSYFCVCMCVC